MMYYYGYLLLSTLFFIITLIVFGRLILRLIKKKERPSWWVFIILLSPFLIYTFYYHVLLLYLDLPSALNKTTHTKTGTVTHVYIASGSIDFELDNIRFRGHPWTLNPKEGETYQVDYLPNSRLIIEYDQLP